MDDKRPVVSYNKSL